MNIAQSMKSAQDTGRGRGLRLRTDDPRDRSVGPYRTPGREPEPPEPDPDMPTHPNEPGGYS